MINKKNYSLLNKNIIKAIKKESWKLNILSLIWTAGPVTFICLNIGYYISYGKLASQDVFIYFAVFTAMLGIASIIGRITYRLTIGNNLDNTENILKTLTNKMPELLNIIRNAYLENVNEVEQRISASKIILQNPDSTEFAIERAIFELTKNKKFAENAKEIELYRKHSLHILAKAKFSEIEAKANKYYEEIKHYSPKTADLFINRLQSIIPDKKNGVERDEGFISRILTAGHQNNFDTIILPDIYEIIILAIELINGREINNYALSYKGNNQYIKSLRKLDKAYDNYYYSYKKTQHLLYSLITYINNNLNTKTELPHSFKNISKETNKDLAKIISSLQKQLKSSKDKKEINKVFRLYNMVVKHNNLCRNRLKNFLKVKREFDSLNQKNLKLLKSNQIGPGIKIIKSKIFLDTEGRLKVIEKLVKEINAISLKNVNINQLKILAFKIAEILDKEINLTNNFHRNSIENSNAILFSNNDLSSTIEVRYYFISSIIKEIKANDNKIIRNLLNDLLANQNIELNDKNIKILKDHYNISEAILNNLNPNIKNNKYNNISRAYFKKINKANS